MNLQHVGIVVNTRIPEALEVAKKAALWLEKRGITSRIGSRDDVPPLLAREEVVKGADLLLVLGGDGTLLSVARTPGSENVPVLAVNLGNLGFLTEITRDELEVALERVLRGQYETEERMMLAYEIVDQGRCQARGYALNDVVARESAHLLLLDVYINEEYFVTVRGDGLIVSTPTGSTAYNVAAGGPILHPQTEAFVLMPISSFSLSMRPFVMPSDYRVRIVIRSETPSGYLRADGQEQYPLRQGCEITAWKADKTITLIRSHKRNFYAVLRTKLHLGSLPSG